MEIVRDSLYESGLNSSYIHHAHALIGRSIFIRYLEDRGILDKAYYRKVAKRCQCTEILNNPLSHELRDHADKEAYYARVLNNKKFTYELYRALSDDFNGDMFPDIADEEKVVRQQHLNIIQSFFYGDQQDQQKLFFFSYRFDIIPLELISAIYEYFYASSSDHEAAKGGKNERRNQGAYYTPPVLAEFTLSRVLDEKELMKIPRVLDPSCGSGVFLVEAFRRIVRYNWSIRGKRLSFDELKKVLKEQIVGIEINSNAASVAAFSLYLAMLNYLDPPSIQKHIRANNKLPNLLKSKKQNSYNCLHAKNAFLCSKEEIGPVDIVVGNPPWGPLKAHKGSKMIKWCANKKLPIKEQSQAFLHFAKYIVKKNGNCALLTPTGVLLNSNALNFRETWMQNIDLNEVYNFAHIRHSFFHDGIAPFVLIVFQNGNSNESPISYWSARKTSSFNSLQAIVFSVQDCNIIPRNCLADDRLWKTLWFGKYSDFVLIQCLSKLPCLNSIANLENSGSGFHIKTKDYPSNWLLNYPVLPKSKFSKYGQINKIELENPPANVARRGKEEYYFGNRILVSRGILQKGENEPKGRILSRFIEQKLSFTNSIHCLKLENDDPFIYLMLQGILWSSYTRYYFFMTSSRWGMSNYEIHLDELLSLPIPNLAESSKGKKIVSIVSKLRELYNKNQPDSKKQELRLEQDLDKAVFNLYDFSPAQRDLINECCQITIPYFYSPDKSNGVQKINIETKDDVKWMQSYAEIFAKCWNLYIDENEAIRAKVHTGASGTMLAVEFYLTEKAEKWDLKPTYWAWDQILDKFGVSTVRQWGSSQIILEGLVYYVSDESIIIIKRNEKRFWTRSLAREDAEATLTKRMLQDTSNNGGD